MVYLGKHSSRHEKVTPNPGNTNNKNWIKNDFSSIIYNIADLR